MQPRCGAEMQPRCNLRRRRLALAEEDKLARLLER